MDNSLRLFPLVAPICILLGACSQAVDRVLPLPSTIIGASVVEQIEVVLPPTSHVEDEDVHPDALLSGAVEEAARRCGLTTGRRLKLRLEIDAWTVAGAAAAVLGKKDRLAGTVYVRALESDEALGQLYVDVTNANGGFTALVTRSGGVRERLAAQFGRHIARTLSGRKGC